MTTVNAAPLAVSPDLLNAVNVKKNKAADGSVEAEQDKFMTLLVTQLKNQDPMNPLDNAQLTSQFAQLSTVTGVNKLNTTMEAMKSSYQASEQLQAANLIGHGVLVAGDKVGLSGGKAIMGVEIGSAADNVQVVVTDPRTGKDVQTINMGPRQPGIVPIAWDGIPDTAKVDKDGKPITLRDGNYLFRVVAERGGEHLQDAKTLSFDSVSSVTTSATGVKLTVPSMGVVSMADIKQIM